MSSPNNDDRPPPDPPHPPDVPSEAPPDVPAESVETTSSEAGPSTPQPTASLAPTVEDELAASGPARDGEESQTTPTTNPTQSPTQQPGRRPLHSYSVFFPFTRQPNGTGNGDRVGLTWTLEVFANDGEGDNELPPPTGNNDRPQAPGDNAERPQSAAEAVLAAAEAEAAARGAGAGAPDGQANNGGGNAPTADGPGTERRNFIFVVGPDGLVPRPGQEDVGPAPFPFLFPFNLPFMMQQQAGPDPAKAAELLASLPTVRRALLRRVDKVVAAEDASNGKEYEERGWRCGICLEGIEEPAESPLPVKALPCNHLFHGSCLEPWFTSHHTCPTCRLDLDPLRTLNDPRESRRNPLRPAPTGSGRGTPGGASGRDHPYARGRDRDRSGLRSGQQTPAEQTEEPGPQGPQGPREDEEPTLPGLLELTRAAAQSIARGLFGGPTTGSPMPMDNDLPQERERTPMGPERPQPPQPAEAAANRDTSPRNAGDNTAAGNAPGPEGRPTPERRPHISVFHLGLPPFGRPSPNSPPNPLQHLFGGPADAGAADQPRPAAAAESTSQQPNASSGATGEQSSAVATDESSTQQTAPGAGSAEGGASREDATQAQGASSSGESNGERPGTGEARPEGGDGGPRRPFPRYPWELPPLLFLPTGSPEPPAAATPAPEERLASTFVPQSLESWTEQREKTLGWRCDAVECLVAPPVPDGDGEDMDIDDAPTEAEDEDMVPAADKEMLSIYSAQQPFSLPAMDGEGAQASTEFVLLTCPHRWHRTCLEVAERSAGHSGKPDADGRQWVRCMTCRKEGWVVPRTPSPVLPEAAEPALVQQ